MVELAMFASLALIFLYSTLIFLNGEVSGNILFQGKLLLDPPTKVNFPNKSCAEVQLKDHVQAGQGFNRISNVVFPVGGARLKRRQGLRYQISLHYMEIQGFHQWYLTAIINVGWCNTGGYRLVRQGDYISSPIGMYLNETKKKLHIKDLHLKLYDEVSEETEDKPNISEILVVVLSSMMATIIIFSMAVIIRNYLSDGDADPECLTFQEDQSVLTEASSAI